MTTYTLRLGLLAALTVLALSTTALAAGDNARSEAIPLEVARIYFEFNASGNDLGVHVALDGEDWRALTIVNPAGHPIFDVRAKGPYDNLGLTELFFEGAEPSLDEVPLDDLLALFPAGDYQFIGASVDGVKILGSATLSHAIPLGPSNVEAALSGSSLVVSWDPPAGALAGGPVTIVAYQVLADSFQVTVPATIPVRQVTVPPEYVDALTAGEHGIEVLAIEVGGNQSIAEGAFVKP